MAGEVFDLEVKAVGLCIWPGEPWLAGSPDGLCVSHGLPTGAPFFGLGIDFRRFVGD